jgi:hypothetical protein
MSAHFEELAQRLLLLTWAVGITAALTIATLSALVYLSYQLWQIDGKLSVLISNF